jgi:hypothetical protein
MSWTESSLWTILPYPYICQKPSSSPSSGLRREFLPLKGKVRVTGSKITVLMFFTLRGVNHYVPKSKAVNSAYKVKVLQEFLMQL